MIGMATIWNAPRALGRQSVRIVGSIVAAVAPVRTMATTLVRHAAALLINMVSTPASPLGERNAERGETGRDRLRQGLNLLLSITQFAAAIITFSGQFGEQLFYSNPRNPLIVPADYAFSV